MELNELMVGDLVFDKKTKQPLKISGTNDLLFHDDYGPIPLTEEILVKNGFHIQRTHDNGMHLWLTDDFWLAYATRYNFWYLGDLKITYVHQLQHLLPLCGVEKEIVID